MCFVVKLALFFVVCTVGEAVVLKLLYVNEHNTEAKYLEFEESQVYRATWGDPEKPKYNTNSTLRLVIPDTIMETKFDAQEVVTPPTGSKPGYSIVFAKDESNNTLPLQPDSENIEIAYFRPYNEKTDKGMYYAEFSVGSGSAAIKHSVLTEDKTKERTENECLYVRAIIGHRG